MGRGPPEDQWNKVSLDSNKRLRDTSLAVFQLHLPLFATPSPPRRDEVINYVLPIVGPAVALLGCISDLSSCMPLPSFFLSGELGFGSGAIFCSCASAPKFPKLGASARSARSGDKFRTHRVLGDERQLLELMQAYDGTDEIALPLLCSVRRSH